MIQTNTVITGDCMSVLRDMATESIDMVITDPPYGIDYQSRRREKARRIAKIANDKAPFIWWIYDAARILKRGGGGTLFYALGRTAGIYRRAAPRRSDSQVGHRVGQKSARHGRPERLFCTTIRGDHLRVQGALRVPGKTTGRLDLLRQGRKPEPHAPE